MMKLTELLRMRRNLWNCCEIVSLENSKPRDRLSLTTLRKKFKDTLKLRKMFRIMRNLCNVLSVTRQSRSNVGQWVTDSDRLVGSQLLWVRIPTEDQYWCGSGSEDTNDHDDPDDHQSVTYRYREFPIPGIFHFFGGIGTGIGKY